MMMAFTPTITKKCKKVYQEITSTSHSFADCWKDNHS